jgi:hypothetical protein
VDDKQSDNSRKLTEDSAPADTKVKTEQQERYWFRPKSCGYGATPVTWEGWLLTLGSMVVTGAAILVAILAEVHPWPNRRIYQVICLIVVAVTQFATIIVSRLKTSEDWRWRSR